MTNMTLINQAVDIVIKYFEAEGIYENTPSIEKRALDWYNHTEITEPQQLAAVTMTGDFQPGILYDEICKIEDFFFPNPIADMDAYAEYLLTHENYSIEEIEEAQRDAQWW